MVRIRTSSALSVLFTTSFVLACLGGLAFLSFPPGSLEGAPDQGAGAAQTAEPRNAQGAAGAAGTRAGGADRPASVADELSRTYEDVAKNLHPSVVTVISTKIIEMPESGSLSEAPGGGPGNDLLRRFFGDRVPQAMPPEGGKEVGLGTGVIVSETGHILTNNHVVADATEVEVRLAPDRQLRAKVVGTDPLTDLAVIKVEAGRLQPAVLGDSDATKTGDLVLAMGSSFGLSYSVTAGIISATGRSLGTIATYEDFLQTDAAINPGNSGGPLVNLRGEVIGINTAIFSRSGGYMGIGFAIPTKMARSIMESILKEGRVVRGYLGAGVQNVTPGLAKSFGYSGAGGALIAQVMPDGPAAKAGLKEGDIVTALNGTPVKGSVDLRNRIAALRPGSDARLAVFREGKEEAIDVRVSELESKEEKPAAPAPPGTKLKLGVGIATLTPQLAKRLGAGDQQTGVVITQVEPGSAADRSGLQVGDIVTAVGGQAVPDASAFVKLVEQQDMAKGFRVKVRRGSASQFVFVSDE